MSTRASSPRGAIAGLLLDMARAELPHDWMLCFDPDERVTGDLRGFVAGLGDDDCDAVRVRLFDAYMTPDDHAPYTSDRALLDFRRFYGPEQRDILMLLRNRPEIVWAEGDGRTPRGMSNVKTDAPLPALRQVAVGRPLGGDLRLLHPALPLRHLRQEMGRSAKARASTRSSISAARFMNGARALFANAVPMPAGK